jgi:integrase
MMGQHKGYTIYRKGGKGPWHINYRDGTGIKRYVKGYTHHRDTERLAERLAAHAKEVALGLVDPDAQRFADMASVDMQTHLDEWEKNMLHRGLAKNYPAQSKRRAKMVLNGGGIESLSQASKDGVDKGLASLGDLADQTKVHSFACIKAFFGWCVKDKRMRRNPLANIKPPKVVTVTRNRVEWTDAELEKLFASARSRSINGAAGGKNGRGATRSPLIGEDREMFYRTAVETGFRFGTVRQIGKDWFHLDGPIPFIRVPGRHVKNKKAVDQPIRREFADRLRVWLSGKGEGRVFPVAKWINFSRMFRKELEVAGIDHRVSEHVYRDFHSMGRHTFITRAVRSGGLAAAQELAQHSDPKLTKRYTHLTMTDLQAALSGLPKSGSELVASSVAKVG